MKMLKRNIIFLITLFLFSCAQKVPKLDRVNIKNNKIIQNDSAIIRGELLYPSEYPPEGKCNLYALKDSQNIFLTSHFDWPKGSFSIKIPVGKYSFYCVAENLVMNTNDTSYYSDFTNIQSESATHNIITLNVNKANAIYNICVCDWYKNLY